jgi:hypothetical protein
MGAKKNARFSERTRTRPCAPQACASGAFVYEREKISQFFTKPEGHEAPSFISRVLPMLWHSRLETQFF